jgi:CxxC-x17-CxxC domain-containing protein
MGNFQGGGNRGGGFRGGNGGGRPSFGRRGDREVTMHKTICDECKKSCEVPFRPSSDKPVYCNECFSGKREKEDRAPRRDFSDRGPKRDFDNNRPAQSFSKPAGGQEDIKKQLGEISTKLDRLIGVIEKLSSPAPKVISAVKEVEVKKAPAVKVVSKKTTKTKASVKKVVIKKKK